MCVSEKAVIETADNKPFNKERIFESVTPKNESREGRNIGSHNEPPKINPVGITQAGHHVADTIFLRDEGSFQPLTLSE